MKAFLVLDELNQFHWAMLKSVLLILALLPIAEVSLKLWLSTEGSSQIMIGFFALSMALLHKDLKVKTSHIYSNLSDNSGMWSA